MLLTIILMILTLVGGIVYSIIKRTTYWRNTGITNIDLAYILFSGKRKVNTYALRMVQPYNMLKEKQPGLLYGGVHMLFSPAVLAIDLDFIKTILVRDFQYFHDRGLYYNEDDDPISAHLVHLEGSRWKTLRSKLTPTFSSGRMKMMFPTVINVAQHLVEYLDEIVATDSDVDMQDLLARFTIDVIGNCAFGLECNCILHPDNEFSIMGKKPVGQPRNGPLKQLFIIGFRDLARKLHMKISHDDVSDFFMGVVKDTIEFREKNNVKRNDFMNLLIQLKNSGSLEDEPAELAVKNGAGKLTVNEITAQAYVFFLAGFETSSTTMSFTLFEFSRNQEIQNKARQCVRDALAKHDGKWTHEAVSDMTYIEQCINESLRKYPPIANLMRKTTKDYFVAESNHVIKKDMTILIAVYGIHHDPEYYPDPEKFDPDRFSPEEITKRHPFAFLPFGEGPRICVGLRFGMMQARIGLAMLLNNFKFSPCSRSVSPLNFTPKGLTLSIKRGMYLKVEKLT